MIITKSEEKNEEGEPCRFEINLETRSYSNGVGVGNLEEVPEDANLRRDLSFVYDIEEMLKRAYMAGRNGEALEVKEVEPDE